jgi:hypothetical protein
MQKVSDVLHEAGSYARVMRDAKVRSRLRAAIDHGAVAGRHLRRDIDRGPMTRLANDKTLHRNVRALVLDLKSARERMERKRHHRVRNVLLVLSGTGIVAAAIPSTRRWISEQAGVAGNGRTSAAPA